MSQFPQARQRSWELEYGTDNKVVFNFFNAVYAWMAVGLAVTAVVAYFVSQTPAALQAIYGTPLKWVLWLGMFGIAQVSDGLGDGIMPWVIALAGLILAILFGLVTGLAPAMSALNLKIVDALGRK